MFIGLGHPRCGTGFAAGLLRANGVDVRHEAIGPEGIVSWMQLAKRGPAPWGNTLTEYPPGARLFLMARSPLAALDAVAGRLSFAKSELGRVGKDHLAKLGEIAERLGYPDDAATIATAGTTATCSRQRIGSWCRRSATASSQPLATRGEGHPVAADW